MNPGEFRRPSRPTLFQENRCTDVGQGLGQCEFSLSRVLRMLDYKRSTWVNHASNRLGGSVYVVTSNTFSKGTAGALS